MSWQWLHIKPCAGWKQSVRSDGSMSHWSESKRMISTAPAITEVSVGWMFNDSTILFAWAHTHRQWERYSLRQSEVLIGMHETMRSSIMHTHTQTHAHHSERRGCMGIQAVSWRDECWQSGSGKTMFPVTAPSNHITMVLVKASSPPALWHSNCCSKSTLLCVIGSGSGYADTAR